MAQFILTIAEYITKKFWAVVCFAFGMAITGTGIYHTTMNSIASAHTRIEKVESRQSATEAAVQTMAVNMSALTAELRTSNKYMMKMWNVRRHKNDDEGDE